MSVDVEADVAELLAPTVADVVRRAVAPAAAVIDEIGELPAAVLDALSSAGLLDLPPEPAALTVTAAGGLAAGSATAASLCVAGTSAAVFGVTEAPAVFVDAAPGAVLARRGPPARDRNGATAGGGYELTGTVTGEWLRRASASTDRTAGGTEGAFVVVVVATDDDGGGAERAFAVDPAAPGVTTGPAPATTGLRGAGRGTLTLDRAPGRAVGEHSAIASARNVTLLGLGAIATGLARAALGRAATHLRHRSQFRTPLSRFPALRTLVADLDRDLLVAEAALTVAAHDPTRIGRAARTAAEAAVRATGEAIQLHGGYGYIADTGVERLFRDALSVRARILGARPAGTDPLESLLGPP